MQTYTVYKWWLASRSSLEILDPKFIKCCQRLKIEDSILRTGGGEFSIMTLTWLSLFCYTSEPNNSTSQQVNNYEKAVTSSVLPFSFLLTPLPSLPLFPPLSVLWIMAPKIQLEGLGSTLSSPSGSGANPYQNWIWCIAAIKYEFWWLQF